MAADIDQPINSPEMRKGEQEDLRQQREQDFKEREIAAREREVSLKAEELHRSRWINPTVLGLFAAAIAVLGNIVVTAFNNESLLRVEKLKAQSNLIIEAIKTGDEELACKNLMFLANLALISDSSQVIRQQCLQKVGPWLPTAAIDLGANPPRLYIADPANNRILAWKDLPRSKSTAPSK